MFNFLEFLHGADKQRAARFLMPDDEQKRVIGDKIWIFNSSRCRHHDHSSGCRRLRTLFVDLLMTYEYSARSLKKEISGIVPISVPPRMLYARPPTRTGDLWC